jgi:phosphoribosylanthranilate isomerase
MKLKICGLKDNPREVAELGPDYIGFIFWEGSARNLTGPLPEGLAVPPERVGVFVDADPGFILAKCRAYGLNLVQLHGSETPGYCEVLQRKLQRETPLPPRIIKAFSVGEGFDFSPLEAYLASCEYFLFDSRGPMPGGNGTRFDWRQLEKYPFEKPFFLSGGISEGDLGRLSAFLASPAARACHALDVNSRFERAPGLKDTQRLKRFMEAGFWSDTTFKHKST